jgi:monoamine oxidase
MAATAGLEVRYGAELRFVRQDGSRVELGLRDGTSFRGARAVLALPVNALPAIGFEPDLPVVTAAALGTNAGRAHKLWLRARGVPSGMLAAGAGEGLDWLYADRTLDDGDVLLIGFGYEHPAFDPAAHADVERALRAFFPDAELVASDRHDWIGDPFSRGTWATATVGRAELLSAERFPPFGRIAFATSDVAAEEPGWIEGALRAGAAAARWAAGDP